MQAAFHLATSAGLFAFYWPKRRSDYPRMSLKQILWAIDPIGSLLFIGAATLLLLALDWAGGAYAWSDAQVAAPLGIGFGLLVLFCLYEWKGRTDGMVAHVFFKGSPNFALSCFAFAVEGWIFYSAVNSVTPQIVLNLGFESSSWRISIRQLAFNVTTLIASIPITRKPPHSPLPLHPRSQAHLPHSLRHQIQRPQNPPHRNLHDLPHRHNPLRLHNPFLEPRPNRHQRPKRHRPIRAPHPPRSPHPIHSPARLPQHSHRPRLLRASHRRRLRVRGPGRDY